MKRYNINNLPHLPPIRFIKEVLYAEELESASLVEFQEKPTLSATAEAGAQNVIFITSLYRDFEGGVLTAIKKVKLQKPLEKGTYIVESKLITRFDNFSMIKFMLLRKNEIFVEGEINIAMKYRKKN